MAEGMIQFEFHSDAVEDDTFVVEAFTFKEEMSTPFAMELTLLTLKKPEDIKPEDMIKNEACLRMKHSVPLKGGDAGVTTRFVYGMVSSFEMVEKIRDYIRCRLVMVPRLWKLSLTKESRVFQEMTTEDIVGDVLKKSHNFSTDDFEFKLADSYSKNEYVIQYNESDLDFVHRWLENEGIYYYFTHSEETKDKIAFADSADGYLSSIGTYRYRPPGMLQAQKSEGPLGVEEAVRKFVCHISKLPASVKLRDYNYRTPSVQNEAEADVEESSGVGTVYEYGDHFKTPGEGKAIATVRAQAIRCREKVFEGKSDIRPLRPGAVFTLEEHFNGDFNGDYVVVGVTHRMKRKFSESGMLGNTIEYDNDFECIKSDIVFRPERRTAWPVLLMINAMIDAGGDGKYAEIDDEGRYKVKLPFDCSDKKDGKASRWIRMAQPYAGGGMGMHFPLHKGTEVLLTFIDGDPDRPIISSAVPNPATGSPVKGANQTQCAIHTGGGNKMVIEDTDGKQQILLSSPTKTTKMTMGDDPEKPGFNLGTEANRKTDIGVDDFLTVSGKQQEDIGGDRTKTVGGKDQLTVAGSNTVDIGGSETISIGGSQTLSVGGAQTVSVGGAGTFDYGGAFKETSGGPWKLTCPKLDFSVKGKTTLTSGSKVQVTTPVVKVAAGGSIDIKCGGPIKAKSGGAFKVDVGADMNVKVSGNLKAQAAAIKIKGPTDIKGDTKIKGDTQIKGDVKIKGETKIKGDTQIKGETKVNGEFKVKGSTFTVS